MKSLIFDIDGTLWDTLKVAAASYNRQMEEDGYGHLAVTAQQLQTLFGRTPWEIADIIFDSVPAPRRYRLIDDCTARSLRDFVTDTTLTSYPKVRQTLEKLAKDHRLFIVSNSELGYPELVIEKLGLEGLIEGHLCHGDTLKSKGQTLKILMERYGLEEAVYIGDTQGDYEATVEAGIPFIWAAYGFGTPDSCMAKIDQFEDLLNLPL